jgi:hypothetical protein
VNRDRKLALENDRAHGGNGLPLGLALALSFVFALAARAQTPLGRFPVCEPSTAARISCSEDEQSCLLVGDNEEEKDLFLYRVRETEQVLEPAGKRRFRVRFPGKVGDIEAMATLGAREVLVFGSYSRDRSCDPKGSRRRFLHARFEDGELVSEGAGLVKSKKISCARLLGNVASSDLTVDAACSAIDKAEGAADEAAEVRTEHRRRAEEECEAAGAFNLEGAVALDTGRGKEVWIGLRSPLAAHQQGPDKAILLRMSGLDRFEFDTAALVDLEGRGIRGLAESGEWVWGIAGPAGRGDEPFSLWRFPKDKLEPGAMIRPEIVQPLPDSSEGLSFDGKTLWVVIDGSRGTKHGRCAEDPLFFSIPTP